MALMTPHITHALLPEKTSFLDIQLPGGGESFLGPVWGSWGTKNLESDPGIPQNLHDNGNNNRLT